MIVIFTLALFWGRATVAYLAEWHDPRSVWYAAEKKSPDPDVYHMLGAHYLNLAERLGTNPRGDRLADAEARALASLLWDKNPQLPALLAEWAMGQRAGTVEQAFQNYLWTLAGENFDKAVSIKGTRNMPVLYYRRGMLLLDRGDLRGARNEFLAGRR